MNLCQITKHFQSEDIESLLKLNDSALEWQLHNLSNQSKYVTINENRQNLENLLIEKIPGSKLFQCRFLNNLWIFFPPFILMFGTFGNILAMFVICQRKLLKTSTYVYLAAITVVDEMILVTGLLRRWIDHLVGKKMEDANEFSCKIFQFIGVTVSFSSVWLIVLMTIERLMIIKMPLRVNSFINPYKVKVYIIVLVLFLSCLSSHFFETVTLIAFNNTEEYRNYSVIIPLFKCNYKRKYVSLIRYWMTFEALIYSIIPFVLLIIFNAIILKETYNAGKARSTLMGHSNSNVKQSTSIQNCRIKMVKSASQFSHETKQLTVMLVTIAFAFLCTTTPLVTLKLIMKFIGESNDVHIVANQELMDTVFELLMYINHSINFYIYCATGKRFRTQLRKIFGDNRNKKIHSVSYAKSGVRMHSLVNKNKV